MSQNTALRQACETWLRRALSFLSQVPMPMKDDLEVTFSENGYSAKGIRTLDIPSVYIIYRQVLFNLPEYENVVKLIFNTPALVSILCLDAGGNIIVEPEQQKNWLERYFATLLYEHLKTNPDLSFSPDIFDRLYEQLEEYVYGSRPFVGVWSVHIRNLHLERDTLKIKGGMYLRRATHEEKVKAVKAASHPDAPQIADIPETLTEADREGLLILWRRTKEALTEPELAIALSRFEDSYTRSKLEDRLIDYWIALEALFFALIDKEYVGNMGETIASTISYYLGSTASERRSIYAAMISSHKARGHFVHGQRGKAVESLDLVVKKTETYLRQALRKRIKERVN